MPDDGANEQDTSVTEAAEQTAEVAAEQAKHEAEEAEELIPVTLDEIRIVRDKKGDVEPLFVVTPRDFTPVAVLPMTHADKLRYSLAVDEDTTVESFPDKLKFRIIRNHIRVRKSKEDPTLVPPVTSQKQMASELGWTSVDDLVAAALTYSRDMFRRPLLRAKGAEGNGTRA
jgi:hypothetical protein